MRGSTRCVRLSCFASRVARAHDAMRSGQRRAAASGAGKRGAAAGALAAAVPPCAPPTQTEPPSNAPPHCHPRISMLCGSRHSAMRRNAVRVAAALSCHCRPSMPPPPWHATTALACHRRPHALAPRSGAGDGAERAGGAAAARGGAAGARAARRGGHAQPAAHGGAGAAPAGGLPPCHLHVRAARGGAGRRGRAAQVLPGTGAGDAAAGACGAACVRLCARVCLRA